MRATGIVRRIDDLGRIVIPKEIRKILKIRDGEALEIFTDKDNKIILKKYSTMGELYSLSQEYAEVLEEHLNKGIIITDRDSVIATSKATKKDYNEKDISKELEELITNREEIKSQSNKRIALIKKDSTEYTSQVIIPLISLSGDCIGSIAMISNKTETISEEDEKTLRIAASFLGKQVQ